MEFSDFPHLPDLTPIKHSLEAFKLQSCNISYLPYNIFIGFEKLETVQLTGCDLTQVPDLSSLTHSLKEINLSDNRLKALGSLYSHKFKIIRDMDLSLNHLQNFTILCHEIIEKWPLMRRLNLNSNKLKSIPDLSCLKEVETGRVRIYTITFESNELHCGPDLSWLLENLVKDQAYPHYYMVFEIIRLPLLERVKCRTPPELRNVRLVSLSKLQFHNRQIRRFIVFASQIE